MGFSARSMFLPAVLALLLTPVIASAQGAGPGSTSAPPPPGGPPPAGGGGAAPTSPSGDAPPVAKKEESAKSTNNIGGVSFNDAPIRRQPTQRVVHRGGPLATFPGFEQLPDGGTRLFVQVSQSVPVEERKAQGSITYLLRGAHLRVNNDANALVTVHFNTPVFRARLVPQGKDLLFILELRSAATPTFKMNANQDKTSTLQIDFPKGDFLTGNEQLPAEIRATGRVRRGKGVKGGRGAPAPAGNNDNGGPDTGEPGPNP